MQSVVDRVQRWRAAGDGIAYLREPASQELLKSFAAWCRTRFGYEVPPGFLSFLAETDGAQLDNVILASVSSIMMNNTSHEELRSYEERIQKRIRSSENRIVMDIRDEPFYIRDNEDMRGRSLIIGTNGNMDKHVIRAEGTFEIVNYFDIGETFESYPYADAYFEELEKRYGDVSSGKEEFDQRSSS